MGPQLIDPVVRERLITETITDVVRTQRSAVGRLNGHRIDYIGRAGGLTSSFYSLSLDTLRQLSPPERLLAETVALAAMHRRSDYGAGRERSSEYLRRAIGRETHPTAKSLAALRISLNALGGAAIVLRKALQARGGPDLPSDAFVTDAMTYDELRSLRLRKFATNCARLRADELSKASSVPPGPDQIITVDSAGELHVDFEYLHSEPPGIMPDSQGLYAVSRRERLECPALQAKLIPLVLPMLVEIVIGADEQIKQGYRAH
jgi:hypothetical protein